MIAYLETSALLKLVVEEDGSDVAGAMWDAADALVTSRLSYPEARAALAAAGRAGRLSAERHTQAKRALDERLDQVEVIEVTDEIARLAGDFAEAHALRAYDALHLASAFALSGPEFVIATWDRPLARAARVVGLGTAGISPD